jgi:hypothetical protein
MSGQTARLRQLALSVDRSTATRSSPLQVCKQTDLPSRSRHVLHFSLSCYASLESDPLVTLLPAPDFPFVLE